MRIVLGLALALACAGPAAAQDEIGAVVTGRWAGTVEEPGADRPIYRIEADIVLDRDGMPAGTVRYAGLNCAGTWGDPNNFGTTWRFQEVITDDPGGSCEPRMQVELSPVDDPAGLTVRWTMPGTDEPVATAFLSRAN